MHHFIQPLLRAAGQRGVNVDPFPQCVAGGEASRTGTTSSESNTPSPPPDPRKQLRRGKPREDGAEAVQTAGRISNGSALPSALRTPATVVGSS